MIVDLSDQEIDTLLRTLRSNKKAMPKLYNHYHPSLFRFLCLVFKMNKIDAEEIVIDVFRDIYRDPLRYDATKGTKFSSWLCTMAKNKASDFFKRQNRDKRSPDKECQWDEELEETIPDESSDPALIYENNQSNRNLHCCLNQLSDLHRDILYKVYELKMTKAEVAKQIGESKSTLQRNMKDVLFKVRRCLDAIDSIQINRPTISSGLQLQRFRVDLPFFVSGALPDESKVFMEMCLKQYPELQVELEFTQTISNAVQSVGSDRQADSGLERLLEYIKAEEA